MTPAAPVRRPCPRCGDLDTHRVHRTWWDRLLGRTAVFRCDECGRRFTRPGSGH